MVFFITAPESSSKVLEDASWQPKIDSFFGFTLHGMHRLKPVPLGGFWATIYHQLKNDHQIILPSNYILMVFFIIAPKPSPKFLGDATQQSKAVSFFVFMFLGTYRLKSVSLGGFWTTIYY